MALQPLRHALSANRARRSGIASSGPGVVGELHAAASVHSASVEGRWTAERTYSEEIARHMTGQ